MISIFEFLSWTSSNRKCSRVDECASIRKRDFVLEKQTGMDPVSDDDNIVFNPMFDSEELDYGFLEDIDNDAGHEHGFFLDSVDWMHSNNGVHDLISSTKCKGQSVKKQDFDDQDLSSPSQPSRPSQPFQPCLTMINWYRTEPAFRQRCVRCASFIPVTMNIEKPQIFSRFFSAGKYPQIAVALHGFRIVEGLFGAKVVEFKIVVSTMCGNTLAAWRPYEDFRRLAVQMGIFCKRRMRRAAGNFHLLREHRGWWQSTDNKHVLKQFQLTEDFLRELLYGATSAAGFINFADEGSSFNACDVRCKCGCPGNNRVIVNFFRDMKQCGAETVDCMMDDPQFQQ